jgi:hypothetical protein
MSRFKIGREFITLVGGLAACGPGAAPKFSGVYCSGQNSTPKALEVTG